jgi:hypothetical protein
MPVYISRARLVLITIVSLISIVGGIVLVFRLGTRSGLERLHTYEIVGMLGLLFLPLLTLWAFYADVRAGRMAAARAQSEAASRSGVSGEAGVENVGTDWQRVAPMGVDPDEHGQRPVRAWAGVTSIVGTGIGEAASRASDRPGEDAGIDSGESAARDADARV